MRILLTLFLLVAAVAAQDTVRPRHNASYVPDDDATIRGLVAQTTEAARNGNFDAAAEGLQTLLLGRGGGVVAVRGRELYTSPRRWAALQLLSERPPFTKEVLAAWRRQQFVVYPGPPGGTQ